MRRMATAFNTTVAALEDELTQLILEGLINARIDSHSKVGPPRQGSVVARWLTVGRSPELAPHGEVVVVVEAAGA